MFSSTHQKIVFLLLILTTAVVAQSQPAPAKEATGVVSGKVMIKGKAAAGIVISVRPNERTSGPQIIINYKGTTDDNGEYRIANVPAGNYLVIPLAPALVDSGASDEPRTLIVNKGETIEHIDFALVRGAAITGKVVDADGRPVVEQAVQVFAFPSNARNYSAAQAQTDDRGIYRVYGLKAGRYKVSAGQGDEGSYGSYRTAFYKRTYHPSASDVDQAAVIELSEGGEATNVDVTLGRNMSTYTASGRIVDGDTGQPLANVMYGLMHFVTPNHRSSMSTGAVSNSRGEFKLENLVPGKYAVQIRPGPTSNWRAEDVQFEIVDEDVSGLAVQTRKGSTVSGVVVVEGTDEKNARADLGRLMLAAIPSQPDERGASGWSMIAADGSFKMSGVAPGTVMFQLANSSRFRITRVERSGVVQGRGVDIKEGEEISGVRVFVAYGNATIHGAVELASGTLPAGMRFYVWVRNMSEDPAIASSSNVSADVDARGQFVIEGLLPGTYEVNAGIMSQDTRMNFSAKKQLVVTAGSVNDMTLSVDISPNPTRP
ncbi:MAG: hypothetical protein V7638_2295 [Acidobacteriota bacterium]|jgi:protocatechuate 3,4-dioxygenase beta subunit